MANIIWSYGVALTAQDNASEIIDTVSSSIERMTASLAALPNNQRVSIQNFNAMGGASNEMGTSLENATGDFGDLADSMIGAGDEALNLANGPITSLGQTVASTVTGVIKGVTSMISSALKSIMSYTKKAAELVWEALSFVITGIPRLLGFVTNAAGSLVEALEDIPNTLSSWLIGIPIDLLIGKLERAGEAVDRFIALGDGFYEFVGNVQMLGKQVGATDNSIRALQTTMLGLAVKTGQSKEKISEIVETLGEFGQSIEALTGKGTNTAQIEQITNLAYVMGLGAKEAVRFATNTKNLSSSIEEMGSISAQVGSNYGIPNLLSVTSEALQSTIDLYRTYGKVIVGSSSEAVRTISASAANISKSLNINISSALNKATESFKRFTQAAFQNKKALLGLGDFDQLTYTLAQTGMSLSQINSTLAKGKDARVFANEIMRIVGIMAKVNGPEFAERFRLQVAEQAGGQVAEYLQNTEDLIRANKEASDAEERRATKGGQSLESLEKAYKDTSNIVRTQFNAISDAFFNTIGADFVNDIITPALISLRENAQSFSATFTEFMAGLTSSEEYKEFKKAIKGVVELLIGVGKVGEKSATALSAFGVVTGLLRPLATGLQLVASSLSVVGTAKGLFKFISGVGSAIIAVGGLVKSFDSIVEILNDDKRTGWVKFKDSAYAAFSGIKEYASGVYTAIFTDLFPDGISNTINKWTQDIAEKLPSMWGTFKEEASKALDFLHTEGNKALGAFGMSFESIGLKIKGFWIMLKEQLAYAQLKFYDFADVVVPLLKGIAQVGTFVARGIVMIGDAVSAVIWMANQAIAKGKYAKAVLTGDDAGKKAALKESEEIDADREKSKETVQSIHSIIDSINESLSSKTDYSSQRAKVQENLVGLAKEGRLNRSAQNEEAARLDPIGAAANIDYSKFTNPRLDYSRLSNQQAEKGITSDITKAATVQQIRQSAITAQIDPEQMDQLIKAYLKAANRDVQVMIKDQQNRLLETQIEAYSRWGS